MGEIKDYVFYMITKEDDRNKADGYSYGIKRNPNCLNHSPYFGALRNIDPYFFEDIPYSDEWAEIIPEGAKNGNVIIVNTAVEITNIEDRMYGIYLPSFLTNYQINELRKHMPEFDKLNLDIDVFGNNRSFFLEQRMKNDFDAHAFLKNYLNVQEERNSELLCYEKRIYKSYVLT